MDYQSIEPEALTGNTGDPVGYYNPATGQPYSPYGYNPFLSPLPSPGMGSGVGFYGGTDTNPSFYYDAASGRYGSVSGTVGQGGGLRQAVEINPGSIPGGGPDSNPATIAASSDDMTAWLQSQGYQVLSDGRVYSPHA